MPIRKSKIGEPCWEIAKCFPKQGKWTESDYGTFESMLPSSGMVELANGALKFRKKAAERPVDFWISLVLWRAFFEFDKKGKLGRFLPPDVGIKLFNGTIRIPDLAFVAKGRKRSDYWYLGADLTVEVLDRSSEERKRDLVVKRSEYEKAGVAEYWIVDPAKKEVTVLSLPKGRKRYVVHGKFGKGQKATSVLLDGFEIDVKDIFKRQSR